MNAADFDRHLRLELCWLDGVPTTASHAGQRQCPHCRRKWSYAALRSRWLIAQEFCKGSNRKRAAKLTGTGVHTAGRHYRSFQEILAPHFIELMRRGDGAFFADPLRLADCYSDALKTPDPRKRLLLVVDLVLGEMRAEERLELLYRLAFQEGVQALIRSAIAARLQKRFSKSP